MPSPSSSGDASPAVRSAMPARRRCSRTWSPKQESFDRYVQQLVAACTAKGVTFRYGIDVDAQPEMLAPFDRIVIATGAAYRFGLGPIAMSLLDRGAGHWPLLRQVFSSAVRSATGSITGRARRPAKPCVAWRDRDSRWW